MRTLGFLIGTFAIAAGCASHTNSGPEILPGLVVPPAPAEGKGWQIITPIVEDIAPATEVEMCTWTSTFAKQDVDIKSTNGVQNEPPGHHIIVFYTLTHQIPGTQRPCVDADMTTFRFVAGVGGEGVPSAAPGNLVFHIPEGAQIVLQHHYLNSTDQTLRGQAILNINFADPGTWTPSGYLTALDVGIQVPPGLASWDINCQLQQPMKLWEVFPHMHQWGKHALVELTQGETTTRLFDMDWDPAYQFHFPIMSFDPSTPLVLNTGDKIHMHCDWNNTTPNTLTFGFEMCVVFGATVDDTGQGNLACDAGDWGMF